MAGDPPHIGGAPVHVLVLQVEDVLGSQLGPQQVTRRGVQDALGFAGRSAGIQDEQRRLGIHLRGRALIGNVLELAMPPDIPLFGHLHLIAAATDDDHLLDGRGQGLAGGVTNDQCIIDILLERNDCSPAETAVRRDHQLGPAVLDAVSHRLSAEAAEHDAVHCTDARASQHGNGGLGDHRQVNDHPVALAHAIALEDIGEAAHLPVQLAIGQHAFLAGIAIGGRFAFPNERRLVGGGGAEPLVEAVGRHIELPAHEPLREGHLPLQHLFEGLHPHQLSFGLFFPEPLRILHRFGPEFLVLGHRADVGLGGKLLGRLEDTGFLEVGLDVRG